MEQWMQCIDIFRSCVQIEMCVWQNQSIQNCLIVLFVNRLVCNELNTIIWTYNLYNLSDCRTYFYFGKGQIMNRIKNIVNLRKRKWQMDKMQQQKKGEQNKERKLKECCNLNFSTCIVGIFVSMNIYSCLLRQAFHVSCNRYHL